ncbi:CAP domain-containing protein [Actinoplanes sp. HUAS TT8]|uniref:CAP domain-containing protein n=1 Tax=Actinoplanes sp. HUAS TT8 TaxID=3447453 RepID=UPI003F51E7C5
MRKSLVVLGVTATALMAGGVVATRAMAQEPPDEFVGFNIFGMPLDDGSDVEEPSFDPEMPDISDSEPAVPATPTAPTTETPAAEEPMEKPAEKPIEKPGKPTEKPTPLTRIKAAPQKRSIDMAAAADPIAASRTTVTADSVSSSPSAPFQQQILALVNRFRAKSGCSPVTLDRRLIDAANGHAADMARRDYFRHESPNGEKAGERVSDTGYQWRLYGENIARGQGSPWEAMDGWMNSPEHRSNILDCKLNQMGVGLAIDGERTPYWVQDFATPK